MTEIQILTELSERLEFLIEEGRDETSGELMNSAETIVHKIRMR